MEHRVREERLPALLDVLLVLLEDALPLGDPVASHGRASLAELGADGARTRSAGAAPAGGRARPGGLLRPRRRGDAETDHEVHVQRDQPADRGGQDQHVDRVEAADRVAVDVRPALQELGYEGPKKGAVPFRLMPTVVAQYDVWSQGSR